MNRDHSVVFVIVPKYCVSHSLVDYEGYSISSKVLQFFNVLSNAIYNSKDMEATHVLINRQLDYKDVVCVCVCLYCNIVV